MYTKLITELGNVVADFANYYELGVKYNKSKRFEVLLSSEHQNEIMYVFVEEDEFKDVTPVRIMVEAKLNKKDTIELNKKMRDKGIGFDNETSKEYCVDIDTNNMISGLVQLDWALMEILDYYLTSGHK